MAHKPGPGISTLLEFQKLLPVPSAADKKRPNPDGAKYKSNYYRISKSSFLIHSSRQEFHINLQFCCHIVFILSLLLGVSYLGLTLSHFHTFTFSLSHFPQPPAWCESPELDNLSTFSSTSRWARSSRPCHKGDFFTFSTLVQLTYEVRFSNSHGLHKRVGQHN